MRDLRPMRSWWLVFIALSCPPSALAQTHQVCVTIDDLPCASCPGAMIGAVNDSLLNVLARHQVPAIGFVNEGKLMLNGRFDSTGYRTLERWLMRGQELGNHTYGHVSANAGPVAGYEADVLRGEQRTRPLMRAHGKELRYFRHPFLNAGATPARRDSIDTMLSGHGYTVAPVTLDNDEYIFAYCYLKAIYREDHTAMHRIGAAYLTYMDSMVRFHERCTRDFLGRDIPQILLLHANVLNAHYLDALLTDLEQRGYTFVTLESVLRDPAYALPAATTRFGFSWIRRWELAAGRQPPWPPEPSEEIMKAYEQARGTDLD